MSTRPVAAITFDLWDTIFIDDSDEPKRSKRGLATKHVERRNLVEQFLIENGTPVSREIIETAYDSTDTAFRRAWYEQNITWTVTERLKVLFSGLNQQLEAGKFKKLIRLHENMELDPSPNIAPGIEVALTQLHDRYKLGIISDAIFSPGRTLRELLDRYNLKRFFDSFVFSDEIGWAKPNPEVFRVAAKELEISVEQIVHIGDREQKDIAGAHLTGARAILTTVVKDRVADATKADAVCDDYDKLAEIVKNMDKE